MAALPQEYTTSVLPRGQADGALRSACPGGYPPVFASRFFHGREKEARARLQRHPLIYPIFPWFPRVSAPFTRGNLHLVTLLRRVQPLFLRYAIVTVQNLAAF